MAGHGVDLVSGRRPRGPALLAFVDEYRVSICQTPEARGS